MCVPMHSTKSTAHSWPPLLLLVLGEESGGVEAGPSQEGPGESGALPPPPCSAWAWARRGGRARVRSPRSPPAGARTPGVAGFQRWALTSAFKAPSRAAAEGGAGSPPPRPHPRPRALRAWGAERGAQRSAQTPRPQAWGPREHGAP